MLTAKVNNQPWIKENRITHITTKENCDPFTKSSQPDFVNEEIGESREAIALRLG
jgi:hypothetical protein